MSHRRLWPGRGTDRGSGQSARSSGQHVAGRVAEAQPAEVDDRGQPAVPGQQVSGVQVGMYPDRRAVPRRSRKGRLPRCGRHVWVHRGVRAQVADRGADIVIASADRPAPKRRRPPVASNRRSAATSRPSYAAASSRSTMGSSTTFRSMKMIDRRCAPGCRSRRGAAGAGGVQLALLRLEAEVAQPPTGRAAPRRRSVRQGPGRGPPPENG